MLYLLLAYAVVALIIAVVLGRFVWAGEEQPPVRELPQRTRRTK